MIQNDLNQLLKRLRDARLEFVVIGGYAAILHGSSRVTRDLDVCAVLDSNAVQRLRSTLADLNPVHRMTPQRLSFLDSPAIDVAIHNLYLDTDLGQVDLITAITGIGGYSEASNDAIEAVIFGEAYKVLSLDNLIRTKRALRRDKDLFVERELLAIKAKLDPQDRT